MQSQQKIRSLRELVHSCKTKSQLEQLLSGLTDVEALEVLYDWHVWARDKQIEPSEPYDTWLVLAGRGWGKTKTGAGFVINNIETKQAQLVALVGPTAADVRDVMIEGESGILASSHPKRMPIYTPSKRKLEWPNGAIAKTYSAEEPKRLRGPQHDLAWCDEAAAWKYPETMDQLDLGLRLGKNPRKIVTTTPRPIMMLKDMLQEEGVLVTKGTTYENEANLAPAFIKKVLRKYEGTTIGKQELHAEMLDDVAGALWNRKLIEACRIAVKNCPVDFKRIVVAVDPSVKKNPTFKSDACGIMVGGLGMDDICYVLNDATVKATPLVWAKTVVEQYHFYGADKVAAEVNNGGALVEITIRTVDNNISYKEVHASRGKVTRAEPVHALYEQGRVKHVGAHFSNLEDEQCTFEGNKGQKSPNRYDALVWLVTELMLSKTITIDAGPVGTTAPSTFRGAV